MAFLNRIFMIFCTSVLLSACDSGSREDNRQLDILDKIKQRSNDDGAQYEFDELNPTFVQDGDTITVNFNFINPDTVGGTPIVEYSLAQSTITSIVYTQ